MQWDASIAWDSQLDRWVGLGAGPCLLRVARLLGFEGSAIVSLGAPERVHDAILAVVFTSWQGDFSRPSFRHKLAVCYAALGQRLLPKNSARTADSRLLWQVFSALGSTLAMACLASVQGKQQLRMVARFLPYGVHEALLSSSWHSEAWMSYAQFVWKACSSGGGKSQDSLLYAFIHLRCRAWYIGKVCEFRVLARQSGPGFPVRSRDHFSATFRSGLRDRRRLATRYKIWQCFAPHLLMGFPVFQASSIEIGRLESIAIRTLGAPTQQTSRRDVRSHSRPRLWPRLRARRHDTRHELANNFWRTVRQGPAAFGDVARLWSSWREAVAWAQAEWGMREASLRRLLYCEGYITWLVLLLGEPHEMLCYRQVWLHPSPLDFVLQIWLRARKLDATRRRRVREKTERWIRTSGLLPCRAVRLRVPARHATCVRVVRAMLATIFRALVEQRGRLVAVFLLSKVKIMLTKPRSVGDRLDDHVQIAAGFDPYEAASIDEASWGHFAAFRDVRLLWHNTGIPGCFSSEEVIQETCDQLSEWARERRVELPWHDIGFVASAWQERGRKFVRHDLDIVSHIRSECPGDVVALVDRDSKRRCCMDRRGYLARLVDATICDSTGYQECVLSLAEVVLQRKQLVQHWLPPKALRGRRFGTSSIPLLYSLYKRKCFDESGNWSCKSSHDHLRVISACAGDPVGPWISRVARALRCLHHFKAGSASIVLWNQSRLTSVLQDRLRFLYKAPAHVACECGEMRPRIAALRSDATAFFKGVDRERCYMEALRLMGYAEGRGFSGILLHKENRQADRLFRSGLGVPSEFSLVSFADIERSLQFLRRDVWVRLGCVVLVRLAGLAMGSPCSPPLTSIDLDEGMQGYYEGTRVVPSWRHFGRSRRRIVSGILHVDDCVFVSACLCLGCLEAGAKQVWHADVACKIEELGPELSFLHAVVRFSADYADKHLFRIFQHVRMKSMFGACVSILPLRRYHSLKAIMFSNRSTSMKNCGVCLVSALLWIQICCFMKPLELSPRLSRSPYSCGGRCSLLHIACGACPGHTGATVRTPSVWQGSEHAATACLQKRAGTSGHTATRARHRWPNLCCHVLHHQRWQCGGPSRCSPVHGAPPPLPCSAGLWSAFGLVGEQRPVGAPRGQRGSQGSLQHLAERRGPALARAGALRSRCGSRGGRRSTMGWGNGKGWWSQQPPQQQQQWHAAGASIDAGAGGVSWGRYFRERNERQRLEEEKKAADAKKERQEELNTLTAAVTNSIMGSLGVQQPGAAAQQQAPQQQLQQPQQSAASSSSSAEQSVSGGMMHAVLNNVGGPFAWWKPPWMSAMATRASEAAETPQKPKTKKRKASSSSDSSSTSRQKSKKKKKKNKKKVGKHVAPSSSSSSSSPASSKAKKKHKKKKNTKKEAVVVPQNAPVTQVHSSAKKKKKTKKKKKSSSSSGSSSTHGDNSGLPVKSAAQVKFDEMMKKLHEKFAPGMPVKEIRMDDAAGIDAWVAKIADAGTKKSFDEELIRLGLSTNHRNKVDRVRALVDELCKA